MCAWLINESRPLDSRQSLDGLFESIEAVSVRGVLLDRRDLDQLLKAVEEVYSRTRPGSDVAPKKQMAEEVSAMAVR